MFTVKEYNFNGKLIKSQTFENETLARAYIDAKKVEMTANGTMRQITGMGYKFSNFVKLSVK